MAAQLGSIAPQLSARDFFAGYISQRKPTIISGFPDDPSFAAHKWSSDFVYLASIAGGTKVLVEPMHPTTQQFGTDMQRISMPFREFLQSLKSEKGPYHYLTTQYSGEEWDALTVFSPPMDALRDDFPEVPRIMGNLFLQQANLWLGKSKDGSSSGLHHDFHDNLYCLLKGRKRFVLFPPQEHAHLYPHGTPHTLHKNGVIAYDKMLRADGLDHRVALRTRVSMLKRQLDATSAKPKDKGKAKAKTKERNMLEKEYLSLREELEELAEDEQYGFPLEDDEEDIERIEDGSDLGSFAGDLDGEDDYDALMGEDGIGGEQGSGASDSGDGDEAEAGEKPEEDPPSFSRIPTAFLHKQLDLPTIAIAPTNSSPADFLNLAKASPPYVVELCAGQMLYLPASWWHEVTSSSDGAEDVHMALNWWFYPPDADSFEEPYEDKAVWEYLRVNGRSTRQTQLASGRGGNEGKRKRDDDECSSAKKAKK